MTTTGPLPDHNYLQEANLDAQLRQSAIDQLPDAAFRQRLFNLLVPGTTGEQVVTTFSAINLTTLVQSFSPDPAAQAEYRRKLLVEARTELQNVFSGATTRLQGEINQLNTFRTSAIQARDDFATRLTHEHANIDTHVTSGAASAELAALVPPWNSTDLRDTIDDIRAYLPAPTPAETREIQRDITSLGKVLYELRALENAANTTRHTFITRANTFTGGTSYNPTDWETTGTGAHIGVDDYSQHGSHLINGINAHLNTLAGPTQLGFGAYHIVDPLAANIQDASGNPLDPARRNAYFEWAVEHARESTDPNLRPFLRAFDVTRTPPVLSHYQDLITAAAAYVRTNATNDRRREVLSTQLAESILNDTTTIPGPGGGPTIGVFAPGMHAGSLFAKRLMAYCNNLNPTSANTTDLDAVLAPFLRAQILEAVNPIDTQLPNYSLQTNPINPDLYDLVDQDGLPVVDFSDQYNAYVNHLMDKDPRTPEEQAFLNQAGAELYRVMTNPSTPPHNLGVIHWMRNSGYINDPTIPAELRAINAERMSEYIVNQSTGTILVYDQHGAENNFNPALLRVLPTNLLRLYTNHKESSRGESVSGNYKQRGKEHLTRDILSFYPPRNSKEAGEILERTTDRYAQVRADSAKHRFLFWRNESGQTVRNARAEYQQSLKQSTTANLIDEFATESTELDIMSNAEDREKFMQRLTEMVLDSRKKLIEKERNFRTATFNEKIEEMITTHPWMTTAVSLGTIAVAGGVAAATLTAAPWVGMAAAGVAGVVAGGVAWKNVSRLAQTGLGRMFGFKSKVDTTEVRGVPNATGGYNLPSTHTPEASNEIIAKGIAMHDHKMYSERWKESFTTTERMAGEDSAALLLQTLRERANIAHPLLARPNTHVERTRFIAEMVDTALNLENDLNKKVEENKKELQGVRAISDVTGGLAGMAAAYGAANAVGSLGNWIHGWFTPDVTPPVTPGPVPGPVPPPTPTGTWGFKIPNDATSLANFADKDPGLWKIFDGSLGKLGLSHQQIHDIVGPYMGQFTAPDGSLLTARGMGPLGNVGINRIFDGEVVGLPAQMLQDLATASGKTIPQVQAALTFP
ncbi:hypothetical protein COV81_01955 [Candidatus Peregrinibacteria bacterium CG11_big_fil_rev_8_21_14_0_20_41_10]|nr:MAG: hypothetical protein COV81_01955 [Candidatus Peregrinibacteria bacterium CG11_big_fil_rev_8_21_14_0_20_41_10]